MNQQQQLRLLRKTEAALLAQRPIEIVQQEEVTLSVDEFYDHMKALINYNQPPTHMSADNVGLVMGMGLVVYPPRVYETIRKLKEANNGDRSS